MLIYINDEIFEASKVTIDNSEDIIIRTKYIDGKKVISITSNELHEGNYENN